MSNFKKRYFLEQQTPLIHFQPNHEGAFLRPSEVKPKLDRFLICQLEQQGLTRDAYQQYLVGYSEKTDASRLSPAFDYKMRIIVRRGAELKTTELKNTSYLGNMGDADETDNKRALMYLGKKDIEMEILCFHSELLKWIGDYIKLFFLMYNFGTRQNKGWGSFVVLADEDVKMDDYKKLLKENLPSNTVYYFRYYKNKNLKTAVNLIDKLYKEIKPKYLLKYYRQKNIYSDKDYLETNSYGQRNNRYKFIRGLLGLPIGYSVKGKDYTVSATYDSIERFKSPLTFKVIGNHVFIILEQIPELILAHRSYNFKLKNGDKQFILEMPRDFDLKDFMNGFYKYFNKGSRNKELKSIQLEKL